MLNAKNNHVHEMRVLLKFWFIDFIWLLVLQNIEAYKRTKKYAKVPNTPISPYFILIQAFIMTTWKYPNIIFN